jgi:hypothetical protein
VYMFNDDCELEKIGLRKRLPETSRYNKADILVPERIARLVLHIGFACTAYRMHLYSASPPPVLHIASAKVTRKTTTCSRNYCELRRCLVFVDSVIELARLGGPRLANCSAAWCSVPRERTGTNSQIGLHPD